MSRRFLSCIRGFPGSRFGLDFQMSRAAGGAGLHKLCPCDVRGWGEVRERGTSQGDVPAAVLRVGCRLTLAAGLQARMSRRGFGVTCGRSGPG